MSADPPPELPEGFECVRCRTPQSFSFEPSTVEALRWLVRRGVNISREIEPHVRRYLRRRVPEVAKAIKTGKLKPGDRHRAARIGGV